uniref:Prolyl 4-hydroxylase alpha subunit Fe(2+) 2OG dioxygenase domain-containing protein n=1 Tax=Mycena chlorophos TaxID=658473 RepID=A0ABQ0LAF3_MYCCL|nr:predicted protein [Mycena chlorophos]
MSATHAEDQLDIKACCAPLPEASPLTDNLSQEELEAIFDQGFEFDGVFALSEQYTLAQAPNPCRLLGPLGTIGLPLSRRDSYAISAHGEFSAAEIIIENPEWEKWMDERVGPKINRQLSVYATLKLKKLVMQHAGQSGAANSLPRGGELFVFLPSDFAGGEHALRYGERAEIFHPSTASKFSTTIVASLPGATHMISPLTSGASLALVYDVVFHDEAPQTSLPTAPTHAGWPTAQFRQILSAWKQELERGNSNSCAAPTYLAHLLHDRISHSDLKASAAKGEDGKLLRKILPIVHELGFAVYLANLTKQTRCSRKIPWSARDRERECGGDYGDDEYTDDVVGSEETEVEVDKLVDAEGRVQSLPVFRPECAYAWEADHLIHTNGCIVDDDRDPHGDDFEGDFDYTAHFTQTWCYTMLIIVAPGY